PDTKIDADMVLMIPDDYVNIKQQKVEIYQRVAGARTLDELEHIRDDVLDRFGKAPQPVNNLFDAAAVKISAWINGIQKIKIRSGRVELFFAEDKQFNRKEIESWRREIDYPMEFLLTRKVSIRIDLSQLGQNNRFQYLRAILNRI
ncbi:MAG: TRCF domain-containing protein, partial [Candidatus Neomarinimicrobiota bacterium]